MAKQRAPIHVETCGRRRESNQPGALEWRHVDATDTDLPSARDVFQVVEDAMDAVAAKRTVEKEDGSNGDVTDQVGCITLQEARPIEI